jgi:tetratricopeptide (TPR) repeat protein
VRAGISALLSILFLLPLAQAQDPEGVTLQIRVVWQNERSVGQMVHLQLLNHSGIPIQETMTNYDGIGQFERLHQGAYAVKVDSMTIQEARLDSIEIMEDEKLRIERLHVVPKDPNAAVGGAPQGPVSSTDLQVPPKAKKKFDKGTDAFGKGNYKKAVEHFEASVTMYPQYARGWNDLGVARAKAGDEAGAKEAWNRSLQADEKFVSPRLNLARSALAERRPKEAEQLANQALANDPRSAEALYLLFTAQYRQNESRQALETEIRLHAMEHKRFADVHVYAGQLLLNREENGLALTQFETYLKEAPDGPRAPAVRKAMTQIHALESTR